MQRILSPALITIVLLLHTTSSSAVEPLRLSTPTIEGPQLRLQWTGGTSPFQLQDAASPNGPWLDVGSPIDANITTVNVTPPQRFFRVSGASANSGGEEFLATIAAIQTFVDTVPTADRQAWRTQIVNFLISRPDINSAGETPDGVWAITSEGIPITMWNNRPPDPFDPEDILPQQAALRTQTPGNVSARFATTVGAGFRLAGPRLARQLGSHGYTPSFDSAPIESLKGRRNESVFFFNTHGGEFFMPRFSNGNLQTNSNGQFLADPVYALWTGTKVDPTAHNHAQLRAEVQAKRLAVCAATVSYSTNAAGQQVANNEWRYGITAAWINHYMSFPPENHASIWLGACLSGSAKAAPLRSAFRAVGAEMVSGWTQNVNGDSVLTATSFLYDRLLGANEVQRPPTPQRPFSYDECWTELRSRGLHLHPSLDNNTNLVNTEIIYEGATGDETFGVFAPSIAYVLIDEIDERAHLLGIFGNPPDDARHVTIGGSDVTVVSWEPRKIIVSLPRTGASSGGDVQVRVHNFKSNVRRITRWTLFGTYKMTQPPDPYEINGTLKLIFRADVGEYRKVPGNVFIRPTRYAVPAKHSEVRLEATGSVSFPCGEGGGSETLTWFGSGLFPTYYDPAIPYLANAVVTLNTIDQIGALGLVFGLSDPDQFPLKMRIVPCDGPTLTFPMAPGPSGPVDGDPLIFGSPLEILLPDGSKLEYQLPGGPFSFGADWAIAAGSADSGIDSGMTWSSAAAEFPPDPAAAR